VNLHRLETYRRGARSPMTRIRDVSDVAERHLCSGCGACAYLAPEAVTMVDTLAGGRRPLRIVEVNGHSVEERAALAACPGWSLTQREYPSDHLSELGDAWGPVLEVWEGHAADPEIRFSGSSGGAATALSLHCLESEEMYGVLHTAAREDVPYLNRTVMSRSRAELLAATGSRYAPASPCDGLGLIEAAPAPCVFIGKPCDVAGAVSAARLRPELADRLGLTIAFFCAGTPTTAGTLEAIRSLQIDPEDVSSVRYRGQGWPGRFTVETKSGTVRSLSYQDSWGAILQRHRQWRCMICPDHTGEFADISVGDPWYRPVEGNEHGSSLVLVRTRRGQDLLRSAIAAGALNAERVSPELLPRSQPNLLRTRGAVWGRVTTMRIMGLPAPRYKGLPMLRTWWRLGIREKGSSTTGTVRRILRRRLFRPAPVTPWRPSHRAPTLGKGR
jgi:coenzyme F420 hydrogenase subunit beta